MINYVEVEKFLNHSKKNFIKTNHLKLVILIKKVIGIKYLTF